MRSKENAPDYRYFPDPDLSPVFISEEWLEEIRQNMPVLPGQLQKKLISEYGLPEYDAAILTETKELAGYFLDACTATKDYKSLSNWIMGPVKSYLNDVNILITAFPVSAEKLGKLISYIDRKTLSHDTAVKQIYPELLTNPDLDIDQLIRDKGLDTAIDTAYIEKLVEQVLAAYPEKVEAYKKGKKGLLGLFVGEVMKKTKGKADPKKTSTLIAEALK